MPRRMRQNVHSNPTSTKERRCLGSTCVRVREWCKQCLVMRVGRVPNQ
jgi:hypothetical protein